MTFHDRGISWFLAQLKPNCVYIAGRNLKRQGFLTFLPMEEVTRQCKGKFVTNLRLLFSGYMVAALNVACGSWRTVNSTHGVSRLVSIGKKPTAVPLGLVSHLILRCDAYNKMLSSKFLKPNEQVMETTGPFVNFVGEAEKISPDRRFRILMEIVGGYTRVATDADPIRPISNQPLE